MSVNTYKELKEHIGHDVVVVCYGPDGEEPWNVSIECETCGTVLVSYDKEGDEE